MAPPRTPQTRVPGAQVNITNNSKQVANTAAQSSGVTDVTSAASVNKVFGVNKVVSVTVSEIGPNDKYVNVANQGITTLNITGWKLANVEGNIYTVPAFNIDLGAIIAVARRPGKGAGNVFYTDSTAPFWHSTNDALALVDNTGRVVKEYPYLTPRSSLNALNLPLISQYTSTNLNPYTSGLIHYSAG
jgi:hypothetical protein